MRRIAAQEQLERLGGRVPFAGSLILAGQLPKNLAAVPLGQSLREIVDLPEPVVGAGISAIHAGQELLDVVPLAGQRAELRQVARRRLRKLAPGLTAGAEDNPAHDVATPGLLRQM